MRTPDRDRQDAADRLCAVLEDGRLRMDEYVERIGLAYQAVTSPRCAPILPAQAR